MSEIAAPGLQHATLRTLTRNVAALLCCAAIALSLGACGKSERQKQAEREAADAQWEANLAAAEAERQKTERDLVKAELDRMGKPAPNTNPAVRPSGWAVNTAKNTQQDMNAAEATVRKSIELHELPRLKQTMIGNVQRSLPHPETAKFRDVHMNMTHDAACGEVDFEYWPDGKAAQRSGYRKFVITVHHYRNSGNDTDEGSGLAYDAGIDIDYQDRSKRYYELWRKVDCTADMNF
jgi:hypothetical protein